MDLIVGTLNENIPDGEPKWKAMNTEPKRIVETKNGIRYKDLRTGKFTAE